MYSFSYIFVIFVVGTAVFILGIVAAILSIFVYIKVSLTLIKD